jgi:hypothetical protein
MAHGALKTRFKSQINNINIQTHPHVITFPWQNSHMDAPLVLYTYIACLLSISDVHYITLHSPTYFDVIGQSLVELNILMLMEY